MMDTSIFLYIDTSVLIGGKRPSSLPKDLILQRVIEHKNSGEIKILNSGILIEELKNNIEDYEKITEKFIDKEDLKPIIERFKLFLAALYENSFLLDLSLDSEEVVEIVKKHYAASPPFASKKTNEFKDAFTASAIKKLIKANSDEGKNCIYIVCTTDKSLLDVFANDDVHVFGRFSECLAECSLYINKSSLNEKLWDVLVQKIPSLFEMSSDCFFDIWECRNLMFNYNFIFNDCEIICEDISWRENLVEIESLIDVKIEKSDFRVIFRLFRSGLADGYFSFYSPDEDMFLDEIDRRCPEKCIGINYRYCGSKVIANVEAEVLINKKTSEIVQNSFKILSASIEIGLPRYISGGNMSCSFEED